MDLSEHAVRLTIYLGESDVHRGRPAYRALVDLLRAHGIWGATVTRGVLGYGKRSRLHSASVVRLSQDLPLIVEAVDTEAKILPLVPEISEMVKGGLLTVEDVRVLRHLG
jgi:PII-like signaling protein